MAKGSGGPQLGCGAKFIKVMLVIFNLIFFILGIAILAIGVYVLVDPKFVQLNNIANANIPQLAAQSGINLTYISKAGIAFCVFGGIMLLISFMGCCGALKQVRCLLGFYSVILLVILIVEIAAGILVAVYASRIKGMLMPFLQQTIQSQYAGDMSNKTITSIAWDAIMYNFNCCGANNFTDFNQTNNVWTVRNGSVIPFSCCKFTSKMADFSGVIPYKTLVDPTCVTAPTINNSFFNIGCFDQIQSDITSYSGIFIGVAIGVGIILLIGVVFGFYLCKRIGDNDAYA